MNSGSHGEEKRRENIMREKMIMNAIIADYVLSSSLKAFQ